MGLAAIEHLDVWVEARLTLEKRGRGASKGSSREGLKQLRRLILDLAITGKLCLSSNVSDTTQLDITKELRELIGKKYEFYELPNSSFLKQIPPHWIWTDIQSIGYALKQKTPDKPFTYIDVSSIQSGSGKIVNPSILEPSEAPSRARKLVEIGTVIYSTVRPYLNNIAVIADSFEEEPIASTAFAIVHPSKYVDSNYLYYYLLSPTFVAYVESVQAGIAYPSINNKQFYSAPFPLPPLEEQKRIVAKIDELMGVIDSLESQTEIARSRRAELTDALLRALVESEDAKELAQNWQTLSPHFGSLFITRESVEKLKATILDLAVTGKLLYTSPERSCKKLNELLNSLPIKRKHLRLLNAADDMNLAELVPKNWQYKKLGEVAEYIQRGKGPKYDEQGKFKIVSQKCIQSTGFNIDRARYISDASFAAFGAERHLRASDILWNSTGTGTVGRANILPLVVEDTLVADSHVTIIRLPTELSEFIHLFILSNFVQARIDRNHESPLVSGTTNQVELNTSSVVNLMVPLPPLEEQKRIVIIVSELMSLCDSLLENIRISEALKVELAKSVVHYTSAN